MLISCISMRNHHFCRINLDSELFASDEHGTTRKEEARRTGGHPWSYTIVNKIVNKLNDYRSELQHSRRNRTLVEVC